MSLDWNEYNKAKEIIKDWDADRLKIKQLRAKNKSVILETELSKRVLGNIWFERIRISDDIEWLRKNKKIDDWIRDMEVKRVNKLKTELLESRKLYAKGINKIRGDF